MHGFDRYIKNMDAFSREEIERVHNKSVCIVGCGGLGGYVAMALVRFGVLKITVVDGDVFSVTNLNRQLFATEETLGQNKAKVCREELSKVNSDAEVTAISEMLTQSNAKQIFAGHDLIIDCLDNIETRYILCDACRQMQIPFVHGAVGGLFGQVATVFPEDDTLERIYPKSDSGNSRWQAENSPGSPVFTPQLVAAIQSSEAIKFLAGKGSLIRNGLLVIDLISNTFDKVDFK